MDNKASRRDLVGLGMAVLVCALLLLVHHYPNAGSKAAKLPCPALHQMHSLSVGNELIGYVVNQRHDPLDDTLAFNVVVRSIDAAQEDYQAICKQIVADVVRTSGRKDILVNIYDSTEACYLYEVCGLQRHDFLSPEQLKLVNEHKLASFVGAVQQSELPNTITFCQAGAAGKNDCQVFEL
jgi:hypothetical protein